MVGLGCSLVEEPIRAAAKETRMRGMEKTSQILSGLETVVERRAMGTRGRGRNVLGSGVGHSGWATQGDPLTWH